MTDDFTEMLPRPIPEMTRVILALRELVTVIVPHYPQLTAGLPVRVVFDEQHACVAVGVVRDDGVAESVVSIGADPNAPGFALPQKTGPTTWH